MYATGFGAITVPRQPKKILANSWTDVKTMTEKWSQI